MFSFHKPKIYRSNLGCCICKAKSSSSRFTDSKKYENEFERCFRIEEKRSGEICNACVLLVKRWKKLSPENRLTKHWHHVVDTRAGPGTKLTSNRRLVGPSSSSSSSAGHHDASSGSDNSNSCHHHHHQRQHNLPSKYRQDGVLPLSSSQANNQATNNSHHQSSHSSAACSSNSNSIRGVGRASSFSSNKARAIDTNVSTFTFGLDPGRRSYMASESSYSSPSSSSYLSSVCGSSSSFAKPQSALNSSAFESVIKRYRQRQQQQQLEAQRRQSSRQQRLQQQLQLPSEQNRAPQSARVAAKRQLLSESSHQQSCKDTNSQSTNASLDPSSQQEQQPQVVVASKRLKRSSESIGAISVDGLRVSALLDNSIWRKEKICCGIIFRGVYNEVAVFPKLLKPCQCRANKTARRAAQEESAPAGRAEVSGDQELEVCSPAPPPRVTKSGSISSCDSNTSGTGSMEQPPAEKSADRLQPQPASKGRAQIGQEQRRRSGLRSLNCAAANKEEDQCDTSTTCGLASSGDGPLVTKAASKRQVAVRPRSSARSRASKLPAQTIADTDSNLSSSSSVFSSAAGTTTSNSSTRSIKGSSSSSSEGSGPGRASDGGVANQLVHSPSDSSASSDSSSGRSSSRRLLLIADDVDGDEGELMIDDQDEDLDQDEEVDDDEELESSTDASSSVVSLTGVQRKKSNASAVGAIG